MELKCYLAILWRRKWIIVVTVLVTMAVVVTRTLLTTPSYSASTTLRVATAAGGSVDYTTYQYAERLMNTYTEIATSGPVLDELMQQLGLAELPQVKVEILPNTELLKVTVEHSVPVVASEIANGLASILVAQSLELYSGGGKSAQEILSEQLVSIEGEIAAVQDAYATLIAQSPEDTQAIMAASRSIELKQQIYARLLDEYEQVRLTEAIRANTLSVVEPAAVPQTPSKPRVKLNIALGFLVGLAGGVGLAFLFENLDTRLHTTEQIREVTQLPTLGKIPFARGKKHEFIFDGGSPQGEALRRLRTNILALGQGNPPKTLAITSAEPGEGKSTIVVNLAHTIAQSGRWVIVVDADLRRPTMHAIFGVPNTIGLSSILRQESIPIDRASALYPNPGKHLNSILRQEATMDEAVQNTKIPGVKVLTSGPMLPNSAEWLGSSHMANLLEQLRRGFDMVLIDTPAFMAVTDAAVLAPMVDAVLLVVERAQAREDDVQAVCQQLADVNAKSIGVVINRAEQNGYYAYYHHNGSRRI